MNLITKQKEFSRLLARLIDEAYRQGFEVTMGETWRAKSQAKQNAELGIGIQNSLHCLRLAVDLNLFRNGKLLIRTEDYAPLGKWWEEQSTKQYKCCWGGSFGDGTHFSIEHQGVR